MSQRMMNAFEMSFWNPDDGGEEAMREALKDPVQRHYYSQVLLAERIVEQYTDGLPPDDIDGLIFQFAAEARMNGSASGGPRTMKILEESYKALRAPIIHGLLREGETLNCIAPPKFGKSWLVTALALCVTAGKNFLGFGTVPGKVLILDNELHVETSAHRIPKVAAALGIPVGDYQNDLLVDNIRGRLVDIHGLGKYLLAFEPGEFKLVVLDALYKFIPQGMDENSNADMAALYALLDSYAARLNCGFVCVHHSTKGSQSSKVLTDVGAGAGSQARAADTHLILRQHRENGCVVLDWVARSWPPGSPMVLRWQFPIWTQDTTLDPADLRPDKPPRPKKVNDKDGEPEQPWTAERFATTFITAEPQAKLAIIDNAVSAGLSDRKAEQLLKRAAAKKLAHPWTDESDRRVSLYASVKQPPADVPQPEGVNQITPQTGAA
jgi:AAA domain